MDRSLRTDAEVCAELTRIHARTFFAASRFLPREKRRAAFAVYAFCRVADDIVDNAEDGVNAAAAALEAHRAELSAAERGAASSPAFRELAWAMQRYGIPALPCHGLLDTLHGDLTTFEIETWHDLERYCGGVASTVGEMCAHVFGLPGSTTLRATALRHSHTLGIALQLTNILRDVGEDAERGRCYLPTEDLSRFGIARLEVVARTLRAADPRWQALMRFQLRRARELYTAAAPGLDMLDGDARCCARICSWGYASILDALEQRGLDSLTGRSRVSDARKAIIMARAWTVSRFESRDNVLAPAVASRERGVRA